jgi:hypothetical protein
MENRGPYSFVKHLGELKESAKPAGYNIFAENNQFATSDITTAAFLQTKGFKVGGTIDHKFPTSQGNKSKIYLVFNLDGNPEIRKMIDLALRNNWAGDEGRQIRTFLSEKDMLMRIINDTKDLG